MKIKNKILVTGGAGFIGSEIVRQLLERKYEVRVVDNLSKHSKYLPSSRIEFIKGDLRDKSFATKILKNIDICIHLAAKIGGIKYFHENPASILDDNNTINSNIFNASVKNKIDRIVYLSSCMVYERDNTQIFLEKDMLTIPHPMSPYGFSKLAGEFYCKAYAEQFGLKYTILRPFNVYGKYEYPGKEMGKSHVVPDLIQKILFGSYPLEIFGNGNQTRCFTYVSDVAKGIIMAMENPRAENEDFNLSTHEEVKIIDLARLIWKISGRKEKFKVNKLKSFSFDVARRLADSSKANKILGWKPEVKLEEGLTKVVGWFKNGFTD